jgi:hypothetical protein
MPVDIRPLAAACCGAWLCAGASLAAHTAAWWAELPVPVGDPAIWVSGVSGAGAAVEVASVETGVAEVWRDHIVVQLRVGVTTAMFERDARYAAIAAAWRAGSAAPALQVVPSNAGLAARLGLDRFVTVPVPDGTDTPRLASMLATLSDLFERVETDPIIHPHTGPSDPLFGSQWAFNNDNGADIDWFEAWQLPHVGAPVTVAVLDTGVSTSHPDLRGQLVQGRCFVCGTQDPTRTDDTFSSSGAGSHGTKCAGIIAAITDNGVGIAGTARNARIMPVKIFSGLISTTTAAGNGLIWATDNGAQIANMSWGFSRTATGIAFLRTCIEYADAAGVLMIASTGNTPSTPGNPVQIGYPAAWPEVIAVGATKADDTIWEGTTLGPELDLVAPGHNILTTIDQSNIVDGYGPESGTSMAAPMVAGVAAMVWGANPALGSAGVRAIVESTVDDLGEPGPDATFGRGRLNGYRALTQAISTTVRCTADFDNDGSVGVGDLFTFLSAYFAAFDQTGTGIPVDVDQNGSVTVEDLFTFMALWFVGCA